MKMSCTYSFRPLIASRFYLVSCLSDNTYSFIHFQKFPSCLHVNNVNGSNVSLNANEKKTSKE